MKSSNMVLAIVFIATVFIIFPTNLLSSNNLSSPNWSGYMSNYSIENISSISANWSVPAIKSQNNTYVYKWIGVGGLNNDENTLIQIGTISQSEYNSTFYFVFIETLPNPSNISLSINPISANDNVSASITKISSNLWNVKLKVLNTNQTISKNIYYSTNESTAEWIVERPYNNNFSSLYNLANFSETSFNNISIIVNGEKENLCSHGINEINMKLNYYIVPHFINCNSFSVSNP